MSKLLFLILTTLILGCDKSIDKIYIFSCKQYIWESECRDFVWIETNVIKKDGAMWTIVVDGHRQVIDTGDKNFRWKPAHPTKEKKE